MSSEKLVFRTALLIVLVWLMLPITLPATISFSDTESITFPPRGFTLRWVKRVFNYGMFTTGIKVSTTIAFFASIIGILINLPASYVLIRYKIPGRAIIEQFFTLPTLVPQIILGYALLIFIVKIIGLSSLAGLMIGHTIAVFPFSMRIIYGSLVNLNPEIEEAAVSLGASRIKAFFDVVLPNLREGLIGAFVMSFMVSFNNVPISLFLGLGENMPLPIAMYNYLVMKYDPTLAALSLLLMVFTIVLSVIVEKTVGLLSRG